jgi:cytochrome c
MFSSLKWRTLLVVMAGFTGMTLSGAASSADNAPGYYGYGKPATEIEIAGWDIDIRADGQGLPTGSGSVEDGEALYEAQCAECHGSFGEGVGQFPVLAGGGGTLTAQRPLKTIGSYWAHTSTLWDYIRRTMPFTQPQSLQDEEVYALVAYVLYLNDLVDDDFVLSEENFATIELPNRANFVPDPRPDVHNTRCMSDCKKAEDIKIVTIVMAPEPELRSEVASASVAPEVHPGAAVYQQACVICHKVGVGGAPVVGDRQAWASRLSLGLPLLAQHAIDGYIGKQGIMPAKGGFANLTNEEVTQAVAFMTESSQ